MKEGKPEATIEIAFLNEKQIESIVRADLDAQIAVMDQTIHDIVSMVRELPCECDDYNGFFCGRCVLINNINSLVEIER